MSHRNSLPAGSNRRLLDPVKGFLRGVALWSGRLTSNAQLCHGVSVACGATLIVFAGLLLGTLEAMVVAGGATVVSISHQIGSPTRAARSMGLCLVLCTLACAIALSLEHLGIYAVGIGIVGFVSLLAMSWGPRATPLAFCPVLAFIFAQATLPLHIDGWRAWYLSTAGMIAYFVWGVAASAAMRAFYRRSALRAAMTELEKSIRIRAVSVLNDGADPASVLGLLTASESALAERLQAARDLVFDRVETPVECREANCVLAIVDIADVLMAIDGDLVNLDERLPTELHRSQLASAFDAIAERLDGVGSAIESGTMEGSLCARDVSPRKCDIRSDGLESIWHRLDLLAARVEALTGLQSTGDRAPSLAPSELELFTTPSAWPIAAVRRQLTSGSPVLHHAVRVGVALTLAEAIARLTHLTPHFYWVSLTVAVVLRGNLHQTLDRQKDRLIGTAIGCVCVLALAQVRSAPLLICVFGICTALAHGFFFTRYWITASCITILALLQITLTLGHVPVGERLCDTLLGAVWALTVCYLAPTWERRSIRDALARAMHALAAFSEVGFRAGQENSVEQRIARRTALSEMAALGAILSRSTAEPRRVRLSRDALTRVLFHGRLFLFQVSASRWFLLTEQDTDTLALANDALLRSADLLRSSIQSENPRTCDRSLDRESFLSVRLPRQWGVHAARAGEREAQFVVDAAHEVLRRQAANSTSGAANSSR